MPDTERPALADVIAAAIEYARTLQYDVDDIGPDDFALQRSPEGWSHATHIASDCVITATIDPDGLAWTNVGEITWHDQAEDAAEDEDDDDSAAPFVDIYLPGDAPANAAPPTPEQIDEVLRVAAVRDERGAIRRRDGTYIADADVTVEQLRERITGHLGETSNRAVYLCRNYWAAIDLITIEQAEEVSADA